MQPSRAAATVLAVLLAAATVAAPASAQSAEEVMNTALERHEARMEGIDTYSVTQEVMGFTTTNRFVKTEVDGHPVFVQADQDSADGQVPEGWDNPYRLFPRLAERAVLQGRTTMDGEDVWHITVDDFRGLDLEQMTPERAAGEFRPQHLRLYLDTETSVLRRLEMEGEMVSGSSSGPLTMEAGFHDYRDVEGMLHPFRISLSVEGMDAAISEEELQQARRQLEHFRKQLEEMPEAQRESMREMMGDQLERLNQIVESGNLETTVEVRRIRVNEEVASPEG